MVSASEMKAIETISVRNPRPIETSRERSVRSHAGTRKITGGHQIHTPVDNHPSGDPTLLRADIEITWLIVETAKPLGISVHDHITIGKTANASMNGWS